MGKKIEVPVGTRFGRWTVLGESPKRDSSGGDCYYCKCDCGNGKEVPIQALRKGDSQSCGCYNHDIITKFGESHYKEPLYRVWARMKDRCFNKNDKAYENYGGRGISVCEEWTGSYLTFREWAMSSGYQDGLWLDRVDNDGWYCPGNCRWATPREQQRNKRTNVIVNYNGVPMCATEAAEKSGIKAATILSRIEMGWPEDKLFEPVRKKYSHSEEIKAGIRRKRELLPFEPDEEEMAKWPYQ